MPEAHPQVPTIAPRPVTLTSGQHLQASARAGVGGTASLCHPPTCGPGRRSNQVRSLSRRFPALVTGSTSKWSSSRREPPPAWSATRCTLSGACPWWMGVRSRSSLGGCGRPAMRRASSPSPENRHLRRSPRCRTPGFSFGHRRTCAWAYSAARATERASGRISPSCRLHQERPPFVQDTRSKCPSIQAPSLAGASGRAVLSSPQSRAAPDTCPPTAEPSGLVHVWSTIHRSRAVRSGPQRCILVQVAGGILRIQCRAQNPDKDELRAVRQRRGLFGAGWDQRASATMPRSSGWWDRLVRLSLFSSTTTLAPRVAYSSSQRTHW
jgi:hypothetical protein